MLVINPLRTLVGCAALAAGLGFIAGSAPAGTPDLPAASYKKAAEADLKFLQNRLDELAKEETPTARQARPAVALTLLIAAYADVLGDSALKADVIKVGEAVDAKKYKDAADMGKKLTIKAGSGKAGGELPKFGPIETKYAGKEKEGDKQLMYLSTTMKIFSNTQVLKIPAGLNIEKDLKDLTAKGSVMKIDPAAIEILAVRSAVVNEFALHNPNEKANLNPKNLKEWQDFSKQSVDLSREIATEAGKAKPDLPTLRKKLTALEASCTNCHGKYRYDE